MAIDTDPDQDKTNPPKEAIHNDFEIELTNADLELHDAYGINLLDDALELDREEPFLNNGYDRPYPDEILKSPVTDLSDIIRREAAIEDFYGTNFDSLDEASPEEIEGLPDEDERA